VTAVLLRMIADRNSEVREAAADTIARINDPAILTWICTRNTWTWWLSMIGYWFDIASNAANRTFLMLPSTEQNKVIHRPSRLTRTADRSWRLQVLTIRAQSVGSEQPWLPLLFPLMLVRALRRRLGRPERSSLR